MKKLESPLIRNKAKRLLSALGQKQLDRLIRKAAEQNKTNRYDKNFWPIRDQVTILVHSLVFDHNITKEQLSKIQKITKVNHTIIGLPDIGTQTV